MVNKYNPSTSARLRKQKSYAELIGNYKKQRIKSLYDNKKNDVEYGTGLFAESGGRKDVPWCYMDEKTGEFIWTSGQHPKPYMRPALEENKDDIIKIIKEGFYSD